MPLPVSLPALRAFVEVGRHGSVKGAAGELGVTPGAVSQQIKMLEGQLGVSLFERGNREIRLTREGLLLYGNLAPGFRQIDDALHAFTERRPGPDTLVVSTTPSFAACWLAERIGRFTRVHPGIELRLETSEQVMDLRAMGIDLAIRHGSGRWPSLEVTPLFPTRLVMVAAPGILLDGPLAMSEDCLRYPLLHDRNRADWLTWLSALGVMPPRGALKGLSYADDALLIQAAAAGQGLALVRDVSAFDDLAMGKIVLATQATVPLPDGYFVVTRPQSARTRKVEIFRRWLLTEAEAMMRGMATWPGNGAEGS